MTRWAALLLPIGTLATILVPLLPHSLDRVAAIPVGVALVGLGYSSAREKRAGSHEALPHVRPTQLDPAGI